MDRVWAGTIVEEANLVQNVSVLRKALGHTAGNEYIETVSRFGYRFVAPVNLGEEALAPMEQRRPHPETRYARSGEVNIAYQVIGSGPVDLVFVMGWVSHLEYFWTEPSFARFLRRLASFSRLILFDKRGTGLSDRVPLTALPTLEQRMDDVRAVLDAVGSERAVIMGVSEGGPMSALFAATYPEKTLALIMIGSYAKRIRDAEYPWGPTAEQRAEFLRQIRDGWGGPIGIEERAPSRVSDAAFREWWSTYLRMGASPGAAIALTQMNSEIDVRHVLPLVNVPALVLHRSGDKCLTSEEGRYVASLIPGAHFVELPGEDHLPFVGNHEEIIAPVEEFLSHVRRASDVERVLATVLCIDLNDANNTALIAQARRDITWFRGKEVRSAARLTAIFDGPARAIRCACSIVRNAHALEVAAHAGLHTGECDRIGEHDVHGFALDVASEILRETSAGEVVVSSTVKDLVAGSGIEFSSGDVRAVQISGADWRLYRVERCV